MTRFYEKLFYISFNIIVLINLTITVNFDNNVPLMDPRQNSKLYDLMVKDPIKFNGVIGNVGDILIKNKLINSTLLVFKYKLIYYSPAILPSIISPSVPTNHTVGNTSMANAKEPIFSIDATNGAIKLKVPSNYTVLEYLCKIKHACTCESCIFNLNIIYSTRNKLNTNIVRVFVDDINKYAPDFYISSPDFTVNISEASEIGDKIKLVKAGAFDRDVYFNKITYILSYKKDSYELVDGFQIEASDIEPENLNLIIYSKLDYEKQTKYEFYLIAQDNGMPIPFKTSINFIINIVDENDNSPICDKSLFDVSVREHKRLENIIQIKACDDDSGLNGVVEYYLRSSNYLSDINSAADDVNMNFDIDKETGWLSVIKPLDYKIKKNYLLTIKAKDTGVKNSYTTYCKVKVEVLDDNDNEAKFSIYNYLNETVDHGYYTPKFTSNQDSISNDIANIEVYENNNVDMILASIRVLDNDTLGNYKFVLNNVHEFKIIKKSDLNEYALVSMISFDHEKQASYLLNLTLFDLPIGEKENFTNIDDKNVFAWSRLIRLNVLDSNDNSPKFMQNVYEYYVNENDFNLSLSANIQAEVFDKDSLKNTLTYRIIDLDNVKASAYIIVLTNSTNTDQPKLWLKKPFDYENIGSVVEFDLQVIDKSRDNFNHKTRIRLHINNTNDHKPVFLNENKTFYIHKGLPKGSFIGRILITDRDKNINETYSNISFHIMDQNLDKLFHVCKNGIVTNLVELDKENKKLFELKIKTIDYFNRPILSSTGMFYVKIDDQIKEQPQFIFPKPDTHYLRFDTDMHDKSEKVQLFKVKARDTNKLTYSITNSRNVFEIDSSSGFVYLKDFKTKSIHEISIEIRNSNGYRNTNNFTIFLNYNENEISADILMIIQMDMNEFNTSFIENEKNELIEEENQVFKSLLKTTTVDEDTKTKNFFQTVSNSVLIVILLVVLAFMILIACFILITAYKRTLRSKRQQSYSNSSNSSKNSDKDTTQNGAKNSSLNSSKLSISNCIAEVKSCLKSQFSSKTPINQNSNPFNSLNKTALLSYYDTNGTRRSGDLNDNKIVGETLKSNSTVITTIADSPTATQNYVITVKDAPISEMDKIIMNENNANKLIDDPNRKSSLSIGSVYNFNTKQISTIQYSTNTSNESNLSIIDDLDSNGMISSTNDGQLFNGNNKLYPKLPYQNTNVSSMLNKNMHNMNSNDNLMQYKEFLNHQAQNLMKKSSNLIAKASDLQNEFYNNSKRFDDFNSYEFNSPSHSLASASTPKNQNNFKKYFAQVVIPEKSMQSINGVPFITAKQNSNNYSYNNRMILPSRQIDRHLQKFERIYNEGNNVYSKCGLPPPPPPPPGQIISYTYTEF